MQAGRRRLPSHDGKHVPIQRFDLARGHRDLPARSVRIVSHECVCQFEGLGIERTAWWDSLTSPIQTRRGDEIERTVSG